MAFTIDVFARYIVGWRVSRSMPTDCVLERCTPVNPRATAPLRATDAVRTVGARQPARDGALIHHADRASTKPGAVHTTRIDTA